MVEIKRYSMEVHSPQYGYNCFPHVVNRLHCGGSWVKHSDHLAHEAAALDEQADKHSDECLIIRKYWQKEIASALTQHTAALEALRRELTPREGESSPDDLRNLGWSVAVHNDYRIHGEHYTFWLFTKDGRAIKGEGRTDIDALNQIRTALAAESVDGEEKP